MKKKGISLQIFKILKIFLATQLNYLVPAAVIILLYGMFAGGEISVWRLVLPAVFPFLLYGLRCACKKFSTFLLTHLLLAAVFGCVLCLHASYMIEVVIYPLVLYAYVGLSFYWKSLPGGEYEEEILHPAIELSILTLCLLVQNQLGDKSRNPVLVYLTIGYLCVYFLYYYLENYFTFLKVNRIGQTEASGKTVFRSGAGLVFLYTALGAGVLAACTSPALIRKVTDGWKALHAAFLRLLLSLLPKGRGILGEAPEDTLLENLEETEELIQETAGSGIFWNVLGVFLELVVLFVVVVGLFSLIRTAIRNLRMLFGEKQKGVDFRKDRAVQQTEEDLRPRHSLSGRRNLKEEFSINSKIRRAYTRFTRSKYLWVTGQNRAVLQTMTARECMSALTEPGMQEACLDIAEIYERARYSGKECSTEHLRTMKKAISAAEKAR